MALEIYPTVAVKHPKTGQRVLIAQKDYDPKIHTLVDGDAPAPATDDGAAKDGKAEFSKMTKDELIAFAGQNAIDISMAKSKTEILQVLESWKEKNNVQ